MSKQSMWSCCMPTAQIGLLAGRWHWLSHVWRVYHTAASETDPFSQMIRELHIHSANLCSRQSTSSPACAFCWRQRFVTTPWQHNTYQWSAIDNCPWRVSQEASTRPTRTWGHFGSVYSPEPWYPSCLIWMHWWWHRLECCSSHKWLCWPIWPRYNRVEMSVHIFSESSEGQ